jgi:hypothetical protein
MREKGLKFPLQLASFLGDQTVTTLGVGGVCVASANHDAIVHRGVAHRFPGPLAGRKTDLQRIKVHLLARLMVRGSDRLGFRRAFFSKPDGEQHQCEDGEEFTLPVLKRLKPELRATKVFRE